MVSLQWQTSVWKRKSPDDFAPARGENEAMESGKNQDGPNVHSIKRRRRILSRTRLVMGLLLLVAVPIFIYLANEAVRENAETIRQGFGR